MVNSRKETTGFFLYKSELNTRKEIKARCGGTASIVHWKRVYQVSKQPTVPAVENENHMFHIHKEPKRLFRINYYHLNSQIASPMLKTLLH